ncbi:lysylphosphatidylglycerol synthase transmembrane domain-containing protein [uncultured Bacteroides sp.]|uniref:lysylphosphatidylglycerol synthase transmembrane domain-containing protein n=1 Tax=uncultured Bacteroides sp. TaxID=162156 RepID=UPI002AAC40D5|nr:lysylphosphatidylglycerol synthase transmembrane domain-containing protein [uncultured Bacteroides sp.]
MTNEIKTFKRFYIFLPVIIGLSVVTWLFYEEFDSALFKDIHLSSRLLGGLLLAFFFMFGRDAGLIWRFRLISDHSLSWRQAFNVNMLCEFTSAVTPSSVGGSSLIVLFLNKEGINAGRSSALMISCLFLDELFLVLACPVALLLFSFSDLFGDVTILSSGIRFFFFSIYAAISLWTFLLFFALFKRPEYVKRILLAIFRLPFIRRWRRSVETLTENLVQSSGEMSRKPMTFWLRAFGITCLSWTSRYLVVNALFFAFATEGSQLLAFARQLVLWVLMTISPTPGGSGVSEYIFQIYYADFFAVSGMALVVTFVWRIITYYMYLFIGALIIPTWVKNLKN